MSRAQPSCRSRLQRTARACAWAASRAPCVSNCRAPPSSRCRWTTRPAAPACARYPARFKLKKQERLRKLLGDALQPFTKSPCAVSGPAQADRAALIRLFFFLPRCSWGRRASRFWPGSRRSRSSSPMWRSATTPAGYARWRSTTAGCSGKRH